MKANKTSKTAPSQTRRIVPFVKMKLKLPFDVERTVNRECRRVVGRRAIDR